MPEPGAEEAKLLQAARKGDPEAFGVLYEQYAGRVFRFLFARLEERMEAEDLTEEVFFRVWRYLPAYRERGAPFGGFVFRVARNALLDHYRKRRRRSHIEQAAQLDEEHPALPANEAKHNPAAQVERAEVRRMLHRLNEEQRTVLELRFVAGLSPAETALAMGKSNGAVRVLQHRALAALKALLERQAQEEHEQEN